MKKLFITAVLSIVSVEAYCGLVGMISTPASEGLISGGQTWSPVGDGLTFNWAVGQNADQSWHYEYTFSNGSGQPLMMDVSHFIISVSENLMMGDVFHFTGDVDSVELDTFGPGVSNPGFPEGQSMYGLKINLEGEQTTVAFDSTRSPMWGDFYAKGGGRPKNYAYNSDFGIAAANLHDYQGTPVDEHGQTLFKVLVPNTVPEPATLVILALGAITLRFDRKNRNAR